MRRIVLASVILTLLVLVSLLVFIDTPQLEARGKLDITGTWSVDPGKWVVSSDWDGYWLYFLLESDEDACFTINGDEYSSLCIPAGGDETIAMPFTGESYEFIVSKIGQGNPQSELLCKIEVR